MKAKQFVFEMVFFLLHMSKYEQALHYIIDSSKDITGAIAS